MTFKKSVLSFGFAICMLTGCADSYHWTASHPAYHKAPYGGIAVTGIENAFVITRSNWFAKRLEISTDSIQIKGTQHCRNIFETEMRKAYGNLIVLPDTANTKFPEESLNNLFGVTRLYSSLTQVYNAQKPQSWRRLIDEICD